MLSECCRTLKSQGLFIRVLPGVSHLIEIRDIIYPKTLLNPEAEKEEACFGLTHMATERIEFTMDLNQESLLDLVRMTPHYWKTTQADKNALKEFSALQVTASLLVFVYKKSS
jgi:23S rRNA (guanine745-N1)-methyltransferase